MNILVYDVAAEYGGALTILEEFYEEIQENFSTNVHWTLVVSVDKFKNTKNTTVISVPQVKKSWIHRLYFDYFGILKIIKSQQIDYVFSMQNMSIPRIKMKQCVYLHQSLQFSPERYSFLKKEEFVLAIRQRIICDWLMKKSLKKADKIIVQSQWMKKAVEKWIAYKDEDIIVCKPKVKIPCMQKKIERKMPDYIIYPAGSGRHKNHQIIIETYKRLLEKGIRPMRIYFTLDENQDIYSENLAKEVKKYKLPIVMSGYKNRDELLELMYNGIVIFPSYLETYGLPLEEARSLNTIILASDLPFAHEILDDYNNAYFFGWNDIKSLSDLIMKCTNKQIRRYDNDFKTMERKGLIQTVMEECQ